MKIVGMQHLVLIKDVSVEDSQMLQKAGYSLNGSQIEESGSLVQQWQVLENFDIAAPSSQWKANKRLSQVTPPIKK